MGPLHVVCTELPERRTEKVLQAGPEFAGNGVQSYGDHTTFHNSALPNPLEGIIQFPVIIVPLNELFFPEMLLKYEMNS